MTVLSRAQKDGSFSVFFCFIALLFQSTSRIFHLNNDIIYDTHR